MVTGLTDMNNTNIKYLTDAQLVMLFQEGRCDDSFGELYRRYQAKIYRYCLTICKNQEEAYDIASETFTKAAEKIRTLKNPDLFSSWLFRIARNDCMNYLQRNQHRFLLDINAHMDLAYEDFDEESALARERLFDYINEALDDLAPDMRQMLLDKYCQKKSILDLQKDYGLSESAVKMRLARARKRIAKLGGGLAPAA